MVEGNDPIPDELCPHAELGAEVVGGFVFTAETPSVAVGMCGNCLSWCNANFDNPITLDAWKSQGAQAATNCARHCIMCEGLDHHWMPDSDDEINDGEPFMACKHCSVTRPMADDEDLD